MTNHSNWAIEHQTHICESCGDDAQVKYDVDLASWLCPKCIAAELGDENVEEEL